MSAEHGKERLYLPPEIIPEMVKDTIGKGLRVGIINDGDLTVIASPDNPEGEDDPRNSQLHHVSGPSLAGLSESDMVVLGFCSNRAGRQLAGMAHRAGIRRAEMVGTLGFEHFQFDPTHPELGVASIHRRFQPHRDDITGILRSVRQSLYGNLRLPDNAGRDVEIELPIGIHGKIILERKGITPEGTPEDPGFPEGLAHQYHFVFAEPRVRTPIINEMKRVFQEIRQNLAHHGDDRAQQLLQMWDMVGDNWDPAQEHRYSLKEQPIGNLSKGHGAFTIAQAVLQNQENQRPFGLLLFADDHDDGAGGIIALKKMAGAARRNGHQVDVLGVHVEPPPSKHKKVDRIRQVADVVVKGTDGWGEVLADVHEVVRKAA